MENLIGMVGILQIYFMMTALYSRLIGSRPEIAYNYICITLYLCACHIYYLSDSISITLTYISVLTAAVLLIGMSDMLLIFGVYLIFAMIFNESTFDSKLSVVILPIALMIISFISASNNNTKFMLNKQTPIYMAIAATILFKNINNLADNAPNIVDLISDYEFYMASLLFVFVVTMIGAILAARLRASSSKFTEILSQKSDNS